MHGLARAAIIRDGLKQRVDPSSKTRGRNIMSTNPYESPKADIGPPIATSNRGRLFPYQTAQFRATITIFLLALDVILSVIAIPQALSQVGLVQRIIAGEQVGQDQLDANQNRAVALAVAEFAALVATYVSFLMWIHRAHRNLPSLGAEGLEHTPGWAVGSWFIPIANLWRPFQVTTEIWKASDPNIGTSDGRRWKLAAGSTLLGTWWAAWVAASLVSRFSSRMSDETPQGVLDATYAFLFAELLTIAAGLLAILVVRSITQRQEEKSVRLAMASETPSMGPAFDFS
jgi:hypothetical protein